MRTQLPFKQGQRIIELGGDPENPLFRPNLSDRNGPAVDKVCDLNDGIPLPDNDCDGIFGSYIIEHIRYAKLRDFIKDCRRVVRAGGCVFLVTANLLEQCRVLANKEVWSDDDIYMLFAGSPDYPGNYHHCGFSPESAIRLFEEGGFSEVTIFEHPNCKTDMIIQATG